MVSTVKGTKSRRRRETGSRTSSMTSGTDTNLSARLEIRSPPSMMALASSTATATPFEDLQLSTKILSVEAPPFWSWVFAGGWLFTMLLQHRPGGAEGCAGASSIVELALRETVKGSRRFR